MNHAFRSTWGALLWKEWRQQRLAALFLGCFSLAGYVGYCRTGNGAPEPTGWFVLLLLTTMCLAANTFAAAGDDRTDAFLASLPLPRWRLLVVKYPMVLMLALLCLLPPGLLLRPSLQHVFKGTRGGGAWMSLPPVIGMLLFATWAVAMVAALASQGLGGMGALLGTLAFGLVGALLLCIVGFGVFVPTEGQMHFLLAMVACWAVPHFLLLRAWGGHAPPRPSRKRLGTLGLALLLAPLLYAIGVLAYQRTWAGPRYWVQGEEGMVTCGGAPSPDGRTVALTVRRDGGSLSGASSATWLLDVETGGAQRVGPRWGDSRSASWSPDGSQLLLHSRSMFQLSRGPGGGYYEGREEHIFHVSRGTAVQVARWPHPTTTTRWLGDGTRTIWTPEAWEFTDGKTGETTRCLHPRRDDPADRKWHADRMWRYSGRRRWLDHSIATMALGSETEGGRTCHYWRTASDLTRTERRDFSLPPAMPPGDFLTKFSADGKWLLLESQQDPSRPFWLLSLVDGRCQQLPLPQKWFIRNSASFTPDSRLLVIPSVERLHVWNLVDGSWEPGVAIAEFTKAHTWAEVYAVSPSRPWRVVLACGNPTVVVVANLEEQTTARAVSKPPLDREIRYHLQAQWLGNDRLLVGSWRPAKLWILKADGSGGKQLLP